SKIRFALNRAAFLTRRLILPACTCHSHQSSTSTSEIHSCANRPVHKCTAGSAGERRRCETSHRPSNHRPSDSSAPRLSKQDADSPAPSTAEIRRKKFRECRPYRCSQEYF